MKWRTPIKAGYAGPAVSEGRVFVVDFAPAGTEDPKDAAPGAIGGALSLFRGTERALALDEETGRVLWSRSWPVDYVGIMWAVGPRATRTVDGDRVYVLGAAGHLLALRTADGEILWQKDYGQDYGVDRSQWAWDYGFVSAPVVDGDRVICLVGGKDDAMVVAFDRVTGKEVWRALPSDGDVDLGVAQPILINAGGTTQLIVWLPEDVYSLNPKTGQVYWQQPFHVFGSMTVPTPIFSGTHLFVTNFYNGPLMLELDQHRPAARVLWQGKSDSEIDTDGLHAVVTTPVMLGDHIYGICSYGQFRCLRIATGERLWETFELTQERARWAWRSSASARGSTAPRLPGRSSSTFWPRWHSSRGRASWNGSKRGSSGPSGRGRTLGRPQRIISRFQLARVEGLSTREAAKVLGVPRSTLQRYLAQKPL